MRMSPSEIPKMKESATHSAYDMFLAVCHRKPARIGTNQNQHEKSLADWHATPVRKAFASQNAARYSSSAQCSI